MSEIEPAPENNEARAAFEARVQATRDALAATCRDLFPEPAEITLEIGCGHGHFLTAYAEAHEDETCVGVDLITKRITKSLNKRNKRALGKLHFIKAEALEFLDALPEHVRIARCFILFPDPWPKKRHWKNRIVQTPLFEKLAARATSDAMVFLRTDHEGYFEWMREEAGKTPLWNVDETAEWPFESPSFFQNLMESWQSLILRRA